MKSGNQEPEFSDIKVEQSRIAGLDCLRGLFLVMVLADHIDFAAYSRGGVRHWTLMGLGFSDAAAGFVFISGFVFGYVYSRRMARDGYWAVDSSLMDNRLLGAVQAFCSRSLWQSWPLG